MPIINIDGKAAGDGGVVAHKHTNKPIPRRLAVKGTTEGRKPKVVIL